MSTSGACLNCDGFSGEFPTFRLLVVDDDPTCLKLLEHMLKKCQYEVTTCDRAEVALSLLRENKNSFHLVISDVHMPGMDGFELLELIALEMKLPVISEYPVSCSFIQTILVMSADENKSVVLKGVMHGAHDYLFKPVKIEQLKNIWQHVVRQNKDEWKGKILDQSGNVEHPKDVEYSCAANETRLKSSNDRKEEENDTGEGDDTVTLKKARVLWNEELHEKFVQAIKQLGMERAVPKKILELMNVPGLKREHVASHLQKYRLHLRKNETGLYNAFIGHSEATIGRLSNSFDLHALAPTGQLAAQNLVPLQAETWRRPGIKSPIYIPSVGQRNHFSFENPTLRYQGHQRMNNSNKQVHFRYGIPTIVEQNPSFLGINMQGNFTAQQNKSSNESNKVLSRNGIVDNARGSMYNRVPQASSAIDFSLNQNIRLAGNGFPLRGNATPAGFPSRRGLGFTNVASTFDASYRSNIQHGILSIEKSGQNVNAPIAEAILSSGQEIGHVNAESYPSFGQEDLMSALLERTNLVGPVENVFGDDEDAWDLPM
ncbi:unnamed protein product [Withania somnifera]